MPSVVKLEWRSLCIVTHANGSRGGGVGFLPAFVCVSLSAFLHDISTTNAGRITQPDTEMFHDESWKPIYFEVKGQGRKSQKQCQRGSLHSCECWLCLVDAAHTRINAHAVYTMFASVICHMTNYNVLH